LAQYSSGGSDNVAFVFSADEFNIYFTFPAAGTDPFDLAHVTYRPLIEGDSFSFSCIDEVCVVATLGKLTSNAIGLDSIPLGFIKLFLPLILPICLVLAMIEFFKQKNQKMTCAKFLEIEKDHRRKLSVCK
jgi:hypothetical protein